MDLRSDHSPVAQETANGRHGAYNILTGTNARCNYCGRTVMSMHTLGFVLKPEGTDKLLMSQQMRHVVYRSVGT